jgi:hypothetical protein
MNQLKDAIEVAKANYRLIELNILNKRMEELTQIAQNCKGFLNQN